MKTIGLLSLSVVSCLASGQGYPLQGGVPIARFTDLNVLALVRFESRQWETRPIVSGRNASQECSVAVDQFQVIDSVSPLNGRSIQVVTQQTEDKVAPVPENKAVIFHGPRIAPRPNPLLPGSTWILVGRSAANGRVPLRNEGLYLHAQMRKWSVEKNDHESLSWVNEGAKNEVAGTLLVPVQQARLARGESTFEVLMNTIAADWASGSPASRISALLVNSIEEQGPEDQLAGIRVSDWLAKRMAPVARKGVANASPETAFCLALIAQRLDLRAFSPGHLPDSKAFLNTLLSIERRGDVPTHYSLAANLPIRDVTTADVLSVTARTRTMELRKLILRSCPQPSTEAEYKSVLRLTEDSDPAVQQLVFESLATWAGKGFEDRPLSWRMAGAPEQYSRLRQMWSKTPFEKAIRR